MSITSRPCHPPAPSTTTVITIIVDDPSHPTHPRGIARGGYKHVIDTASEHLHYLEEHAYEPHTYTSVKVGHIIVLQK